MKSLQLLFTDSYISQGFTPGDAVIADMRDLDGVNCFCTSEEAILERLPSTLPFVRWTDGGDYHYMSFLLSLRETEPFHLLLLDRHTDNQETAFGDVLSCGSWVREMQRRNPLLKDVLTVQETTNVSQWLQERRGERLYVSIDKDVLSPDYARTNWDQGNMTLQELEGIVAEAAGVMQIAAIDICGELSSDKGAKEDDFAINLRTNRELETFIDTICPKN